MEKLYAFDREIRELFLVASIDFVNKKVYFIDEKRPAEMNNVIFLSETCTKDAMGTNVKLGDILELKENQNNIKGVVKFGRYSDLSSDKETHIGFYIDWASDYLRKDIAYWDKNEQLTIVGNVFINYHRRKVESKQ